jgi:hypothetical protein
MAIVALRALAHNEWKRLKDLLEERPPLGREVPAVAGLGMARERVEARERARAAVTETLRGNAVVDLNVASHVPVGTRVVAGGKVASHCVGANEGAAEVEDLLQARRDGVVVRGRGVLLS